MAKILIVDDIPSNRGFLVALLEHQGHRILEAGDGAEGLASVHAEYPDLIISDVLMPVMDGYEFVKQLRLDPATRKIPVLFYTAHYGEDAATALALASGVSGVLSKPVRSADVLSEVDRVLSIAPAASAAAHTPPLAAEFDQRHLRLVTDKLSEKVGDLKSANERLIALINIGVELASEGNADRRLISVCTAARQLFDASYVSIGIVGPNERTIERVVTCGTAVRNWIQPGDSVSGILQTVVGDRRTLRGRTVGGDPGVLRLPVITAEAQTYITTPIASSAKVYGWISVAAAGAIAITDEDEHLVRVLSDQVGRILELEREVRVRQEAEIALRVERDRAQRYLDTAEVILLKLDLDGRVALVNRYACWMLGWTTDELMGRDWIDTCLPVRIRAEMRQKFENLGTGDLAIVENPILTRSGEERMIEWRNSLLRDDTGQIIGTFSSGTDITQRTLAGEALQRSEERTRFALDAAGVGIWDMDYATGVLQWSEILESQYGLRPGAFGGTFDAFVHGVHPEDREAVIDTMARANLSGADFTVHNRALWPDGSVHWLSGAGRIHLGDHGQPVRGVGISLDVTARHSLEAQFQQAQKMEAVGQLAGGVAHDFNNLLTAILGYCELLLLDLDPTERARNDIAEIQKAGISAAGLTRQLLAFSRKQIIEPTVLDLNGIVTNMRAMFTRLIGEDIAVVLGLEPELSCIMADRGQVEQVVMNLAVNARDAMPAGGTLTVETANVVLDEQYAETHLSVKPGAYVVLTVTDTGTGMTPGVQARLFEPFFTTKDVGKGTGLGLATVHGIATSSGGSISVHSELGLGTSFKVYYPAVAAGSVVAAAPAPVGMKRIGGETVLVVDDAEGLRELTTRLLERLGYTVLVAANAAEAVDMFERTPSIDVLLTDVLMPGTSGPELTKRLIKQRPTLKVIFMSGYTDDVIGKHGILNPGTAFLHKPFTSDMLGRKIREVLEA